MSWDSFQISSGFNIKIWRLVTPWLSSVESRGKLKASQSYPVFDKVYVCFDGGHEWQFSSRIHVIFRDWWCCALFSLSSQSHSCAESRETCQTTYSFLNTKFSSTEGVFQAAPRRRKHEILTKNKRLNSKYFHEIYQTHGSYLFSSWSEGVKLNMPRLIDYYIIY